MRIAFALALALALGSAVAHAEVPPHVKAKLERDAAERKEALAKLADALVKNDTQAVAGLLGAEVKLKGLWFPSESCRKEFGGRAVAKDANALAGCLLEVKLKPSNGYLVHEPGGEWWMTWKGGKLVSIGTLEIDPASPTITRDVFQKHAKRSLDVKRDPKTREMMKKDPELLVSADVRICVDAKGKVDSLAVTSEPAFESYRAAVEAAAKKWTFKPFKHAGKPIRVCSTHWAEQYDGSGVPGGIVGGAIDDPEPPAPAPPPPVQTAKK